MKAWQRVVLFALVLIAGSLATLMAAASAAAADVTTCTESSSRRVVTSFIDAFNNGDAAKLDQFVADYAQYATDAPGAFSSPAPVNRSELVAYFMQRHRAHERLQLKSLQFNGRWANAFNFQFQLTRSADGLAPTSYGGLGAIFCGNPSNALINWGMGRTPFPEAGPPFTP